MSQPIICRGCKHPITDKVYECVECSQFFGKEIIFCQRCISDINEHGSLRHQSIPVDYTQDTNTKLFHSIIAFEEKHLPQISPVPKVFPYSDEDSSIWKINYFSKISYRLPHSDIPFRDSIPFVCDYLRMNNSLNYLTDKLSLDLCSTDVIILILKYSAFNTRLFILEQLCLFRRAIPIYFGTAAHETSSIKYYFLMQEMLQLLLPYTFQKIPFILSFGTRSSKEKTLLLNTILKTNFDCHQKIDRNVEIASSYYHQKLIQMLIGYRYATDRDASNEIKRIYQCHIVDFHGIHGWNELPHYFIDFMSVIIIHIDASDLDQIDSFAWSSVAFNQTATYLIFLHGHTSDPAFEEKSRLQIQKHFGSNKGNLHIISAYSLLHENKRAAKSTVIKLLKEAPVPNKSLEEIPAELLKQHNINLSTNANTLTKSKALIHEFQKIFKTLSQEDPSRELFPLSRLKELSEKKYPSKDEQQQKKQLETELHQGVFNNAHKLLTKLTEWMNDDNNNIALFEKAVLLWNGIVWQQKLQTGQTPPISILEKVEMSKERFLREFQERSAGYTNLNGRHCSFHDAKQMKKALIEIYQHSFRGQEYIEIINTISTTTYADIFHEAFSDKLNDLKDFFVIGIIGEQSGGKSFLINKVFGTKIAESKFKCTTGVLATRVGIIEHNKVKSIVILDTEGLLDQSKKTNEAQIFDRKIVLAIMARSRVILVNITRNVNKTMQHILEIVFYGLNKLQITIRPKIIFLFRDQNPSSLEEDGQRTHVAEVMRDIQDSCQQSNFNVQNIIDGFDIHEFPSPFGDSRIGEREESFYNDSFCQKALALRVKIIDYLKHLDPFDSFNEWLKLTSQQWQEINHNYNLFDYESLVHLTLEMAFERFSNRVLLEANEKLRVVMDGFYTYNKRNQSDNDNCIREITRKLNNTKDILCESLLKQLEEKKQMLITRHSLAEMPEKLFENTKTRIKSTLDLYKADHLTEIQRRFQRDEFQRKLDEIPKNLISFMQSTQNISKNAEQFEDLIQKHSMRLLVEFKKMLRTDYKSQCDASKEQLIETFVARHSLDKLGVNFFYQYIKDSALIEIIEQTVLSKQETSGTERSICQSTRCESPINTHGHGYFRAYATRINSKFSSTIKDHSINQQLLEKMLMFLKIQYSGLRNNSYYNSNLLPVPKMVDDCVKNIGEAIEKNQITDQGMKNIWYTCYGIKLNIFCDKHFEYICEKLISEFQREISRRKVEVRQCIVNATTAEEHGETLIQQIWTTIQIDIQKQFQDKFERFFGNWDEYRPSIITENCVNQLFRSNTYQKMFDYIKEPPAFVKKWLYDEFSKKYESQLNQTLRDLSSHLLTTKKRFHQMISAWYVTFQATVLERTVEELIESLKVYLSDGKYMENDVTLKESSDGFAFPDAAVIRTIPSSADKACLLKAILSTADSIRNKSDDDNDLSKSTRTLIDNEQLKNRLFDRFYSKASGCGIPCPYCKQMCDNDNPEHTEHRTEHHLLRVFSGYRYQRTSKPCLVCCTSNQAFIDRIQSLTDEDIYIPFTEHIERFNPTWKIINKMTPLQDFQLKAYIALEEDLAELFRFTGRADIDIRKKFLRSTVTAHCHGLLVGIDYAHTPDSLGGIPINNVSCIQEQLILSSIAYPENLCVLNNDQATKENILTKLNTILANLNERSTFIFYFAGHGGRTKTSSPVSYLVMSDHQKLSADELATAIGRAKTKKIIIMLDSCYSGGISNGFKFDSNNCQHGIYVLCSSRETQTSLQLVGDQNSFFTKHLIRGLQGQYACEKDNCHECMTRTENLQKASIRKVTSTELALYLQHAVTGHQHFTYTSINGLEFDISFIN